MIPMIARCISWCQSLPVLYYPDDTHILDKNDNHLVTHILGTADLPPFASSGVDLGQQNCWDVPSGNSFSLHIKQPDSEQPSTSWKNI